MTNKAYNIVKGQRKSNFTEGNMNNISDLIENFIIETIGSEDSLNLSRNELANFFNVSPSQINYVLSTRFTLNRGYLTESKRGGGGYILIKKIDLKDDYLSNLIKNLDFDLDYTTCLYILENLQKNNFINSDEYSIIKSAISPKSLSSPFKIENNLRHNIFKNILINIQNRGK